MFGEPSVCGTHSIESCGRGNSSSTPAPRTAGSLSALSLALIVATGPPRRISVERRHASLNALVLCDGPRDVPSRLKAQYALLVWFISAMSRT